MGKLHQITRVDQVTSTNYNDTMMNIYKCKLEVEDEEVKAPDQREALRIFKKAVTDGLYGPVMDDVELIGPVEEEEEEEKEEKE